MSEIVDEMFYIVDFEVGYVGLYVGMYFCILIKYFLYLCFI